MYFVSQDVRVSRRVAVGHLRQRKANHHLAWGRTENVDLLIDAHRGPGTPTHPHGNPELAVRSHRTANKSRLDTTFSKYALPVSADAAKQKNKAKTSHRSKVTDASVGALSPGAKQASNPTMPEPTAASGDRSRATPEVQKYRPRACQSCARSKMRCVWPSEPGATPCQRSVTSLPSFDSLSHVMSCHVMS